MKKRKTIRRKENIINVRGEDLVIVPLKTYRSWCTIPYPGHPKGCSMWNKGKRCIQTTRKMHTFDEFFDRSAPMWFVWIEYDLGAWARKMKERHSDWSERQCRNVLYWQAAEKKRRNKFFEQFIIKRRLKGKYAGITEGFCINVYATCRNAGLILDPIKDIQIVRKIILAAKWKDEIIKSGKYGWKIHIW